jgi:hypothetical protein
VRGYISSFVPLRPFFAPPPQRNSKNKRTGKKTFRRPITKTFLTRAKTLVGDSKRSERVLDRLYALRSCVEHVKEVRPELPKPKGVSHEEAFAFHALQAELLASTVYSRIFMSERLREALRTEKGVEGFWRRSPQRRSFLFGEAINLSKRVRQEFRSFGPMDLL